jgi:putative transposase
MLEKPLLFPIKPGVVAAWNARTVVIVGPTDGSSTRVHDVATGEERDVSVDELQGIPAIGQIESPEQKWALVRGSTRAEWKQARRRERVLKRCLSEDGDASARVQFACKSLGLSRRSIYRLLANYRAAAQTSSLIAKHRGTPPAGRRLTAAREAIAMRCIEQRFLSRPRATVSLVTEEVERQCRAAGLKPVSRKAIDLRIASLDPRLVTSRRHGSKVARTAFGPVGGHYDVSAPLDVMQIDHTRVDVIVVSEGSRKPLGRPWITLAIDVATRIVMGIFISFDAPSITSVCLALTHACLPKNRWLAARNIDIEWNQWGIPAALHMDNAREFHSQSVRRGCDEYGIKKIFRPIARPHFGGHIERLIGTLMGRVHLLPGTTSSSIAARGSDNPKHTAAMTIAEVESWIALEIAGRYHRKTHRSLGVSPLAAWEAAVSKGLYPSLPSDTRSFMVNFLPLATRILQKDGIHLFNIRYWSERLPLLARPHESVIVRYDPRNLARVFVLGYDKQYHEVPYGDVRHPPISIWDHRAAAAYLRAHQRKVDELGIFSAHLQQRTIESEAMTATRLARSRSTKIPIGTPPPVIAQINYDVPAQELESETWQSSL